MTTEHASFAGQLAWDLGNGFNFSYLLGAYFDIHSQFAWSSTSLNQRFAFTYNRDGWNLTANLIWGIQFDEVSNRPPTWPQARGQPLNFRPRAVPSSKPGRDGATKYPMKWAFLAIFGRLCGVIQCLIVNAGTSLGSPTRLLPVKGFRGRLGASNQRDNAGGTRGTKRPACPLRFCAVSSTIRRRARDRLSDREGAPAVPCISSIAG